MKPIIEVKNLSKKYRIVHEKKPYHTLREDLVELAKTPVRFLRGHRSSKKDFWALKDVDFSVNKGEVLGIIGKNGAGKSTLLKILSRITSPTSGQAILRGRVASLLEVGTGFHPELTGRENIFLNGTLLGMSRQEIKRKFDEIVAFSEIEKFLDTPVKFYSSGMHVRLGFAVAAHLEPEILIVDEVLAVGDVAFQKKSLGKMSSVAKEGRTVLFVSHNMDAVKKLCQRGILLENGEIKEIGDSSQVIDFYLSKVKEDAVRVPLAGRTRDKDLSLEARFTDVSLITDKGENQQIVDSTKPLTVRFTIDVREDIGKPVAVHLVFYLSPWIILRFHSEHREKYLRLKKGKNVVECKIQPTFLTGGDYQLSCSLLHPGREKLRHIDYIQDAHFFTVKDLKIRGGVDFFKQKDAIYFVEHDWEIK